MRRVSLLRQPLVVAGSSAGIGFICGALFWHLIGFWSFISHVVLRGPDDEMQQARAQAATAVPAHLRATGSISPVRPTATRKAIANCSIAVPTADGETEVLACPAGTPAAPATPLARKTAKMLPTNAVQATPASLAGADDVPTWTPLIRGQAR